MLKRVKGAVVALSLAVVSLLAMDNPGHTQDTDAPVYVQRGVASWYGPGFHGRKTASGKRFNQHRLTAAHRTLPLGTKATVTNLENGNTVQVEITDRGPYVRGRILDLSKAAANQLGMTDDGTTTVRLVVTAEQQADNTGDL